MAWVICSRQDVQDLANIPQNALPDSWSEMVEGLIRQHVGSPYIGKTETTSESHTGTGDGIITVDRSPIAYVNSIYINGIEYLDEYTVNETTITIPTANYDSGDVAIVNYESLGITISETQSIYEATYVIRVRKGPIISVTSLTVDSVALTADDYYVDHSNIFLKTRKALAGNLNVEVTYVSGTATINPTYRLAAIAMIIALYNYKQRSGADSSIVWADPDVKAGEKTQSKSTGLLDHLQRIMMSTIRRNKVRANI